MNYFGFRSKGRLETCHPALQRLFNEVVIGYDCQIICGHRNKESQDDAYGGGYTTKPYPESKHNSIPSLAVDVLPYPFAPSDWNNHKRFYHFAGYVKRVAEDMGISVRWGGDWDTDTDLDDQFFNDLPHWELR